MADYSALREILVSAEAERSKIQAEKEAALARRALAKANMNAKVVPRLEAANAAWGDRATVDIDCETDCESRTQIPLSSVPSGALWRVRSFRSPPRLHPTLGSHHRSEVAFVSRHPLRLSVDPPCVSARCRKLRDRSQPCPAPSETLSPISAFLCGAAVQQPYRPEIGNSYETPQGRTLGRRPGTSMTSVLSAPNSEGKMRLFLVLILMALSGCVSNVSPDSDGIPRRASFAGSR